jgi:hypothetical protein
MKILTGQAKYNVKNMFQGENSLLIGNNNLLYIVSDFQNGDNFPPFIYRLRIKAMISKE